MPSRRAPLRSFLVAVVTASALALSACAPAGSTRTVEGVAISDGVRIADTPVGERSQWVLEVLAADDDTTAAEWEPHLDDSFTAQVSAADVAELINRQIRPAGPFTVTAYSGDEATAVTTIAGEIGDPFDMSVTLGDDGRMVAFFLTPAAEP